MPGQSRVPGTEGAADTAAARGGGTRFTAVGAGVVTCVVTLAGGAVDFVLFQSLGTLFGLVFLATCLFTAARVRPCDLPAAPVSAPIAFALTLVVVQPAAEGGFTGQLLAVVTGLAMHAGWLYGGTLLAAALVLARRVTLTRTRRSS